MHSCCSPGAEAQSKSGDRIIGSERLLADHVAFVKTVSLYTLYTYAIYEKEPTVLNAEMQIIEMSDEERKELSPTH